MDPRTICTALFWCAVLGAAVIAFEKANGAIFPKIKRFIPFA